MPRLSDIRIRDPFILHDEQTATYYLYGTTDADPWDGPGTGFASYSARDLTGDWTGPASAFVAPDGFWATTQFWAPEVHRYQGRYVMFATFADGAGRRGTQVLAADSPRGPFLPISDGPVTPPSWSCLDGTLHLDGAGDPWLVYCHEWTQTGDGRMVAQRLSRDLRATTGEPAILFTASQASWTRPNGTVDGAPAFVTDGPFLITLPDGTLAMIWSSFGDDGYALGMSLSPGGSVLGPWQHEPEPLWRRDGGHGMLFTDAGGLMYVVLHGPNATPAERTILHRVEFAGNALRLAASPAVKND